MTARASLKLNTENMIAEIDGAIGWMIFNKPARRNAVSLDMWAAIPEIIDHFEKDPAVRVVVLKGAGDQAFVSGADISEFEAQRASGEGNRNYDRVSDEASARLINCGKPTIAMINGWCIGGGMGIALECDLRIASESARFGIPASRLGLGYGAPGVKKLMEVVGPSFTKEIFYTARHFTAAEALTMGLVNRVVPVAELETYTRGYCATIADNAPMTINTLKRTVGELLKGPDYDAALCARLVTACFESEDYIEGRRAFMEKRRPAFRGR
ncbi:MAG TPA: enoyl-CoA hydratase [Rhodopila sp.]|uniref:enoyl-CoA hydratase n=1 Tax=Rhodopila sp. TaxID=2480087 RepID=UPI002C7467FB|nr:enoyl-CoA hydratase [Rhodopila sp.]HVY18113.1 enoyl-CoA hydratase [Rhodopila sp.]